MDKIKQLRSYSIRYEYEKSTLIVKNRKFYYNYNEDILPDFLIRNCFKCF